MFYITQVPQSREAVVAAHTWLTSIDSIAWLHDFCALASQKKYLISGNTCTQTCSSEYSNHITEAYSQFVLYTSVPNTWLKQMYFDLSTFCLVIGKMTDDECKGRLCYITDLYGISLATWLQ
jgi:hypothetical protein